MSEPAYNAPSAASHESKSAHIGVRLGEGAVKYALGAFTFDTTEAVLYTEDDGTSPIITFGLSTFLRPFGHFKKGDQGWVELAENMFVVWGDKYCELELLHLPVAAILWPELNIGKDRHSQLCVREVQRLKGLIQSASNVKNFQEIAELRKSLPPAKQGKGPWDSLKGTIAKINAQEHPLPWAEALIANLTDSADTKS
jgi:hypothetical protein